MEIYNPKDFVYAKVYLKHDNHINKYKDYKIRPVLILKQINKKYYECLSITSLLKDGKQATKTRLDVYTNYNFKKHSQIICDTSIIVDISNFKEKISICNQEDFDFIVNRVKELKYEKIPTMEKYYSKNK